MKLVADPLTEKPGTLALGCQATRVDSPSKYDYPLIRAELWGETLPKQADASR